MKNFPQLKTKIEKKKQNQKHDLIVQLMGWLWVTASVQT